MKLLKNNKVLNLNMLIVSFRFHSKLQRGKIIYLDSIKRKNTV